jgi:hypothetical protein
MGEERREDKSPQIVSEIEHRRQQEKGRKREREVFGFVFIFLFFNWIRCIPP